MILCLETATTLCSVALCDRNGVAASRESNDSKSHASLLTVFIGELLSEAGITAYDLDAISVSKGPGSYTGLRIGVSAAKGLAFAASRPLIGIETTLSMYHGLRENLAADRNTLFCPMLDARRMEIYYAVYDSEGKIVKHISAEVIDENSFADLPAGKEIIMFGPGAMKLKDSVKRPGIMFRDDFRMSAAHQLKPAYASLDNGYVEDVAYFEPLYLKDFVATIPKKNILGS